MFHVVLRLRHFVGVFTCVLIELFQNVEKLCPVLLLLFILQEQAVVLKELLFSTSLVQVLWLGAVFSSEHQILWLIVNWVNWTSWLCCVNLQLFNVPSLEGKRTKLVLDIVECFLVFFVNYFLIFLLNDCTEGHLLVESILIHNFLVVLSLLVRFLQRLFFVT